MMSAKSDSRKSSMPTILFITKGEKASSTRYRVLDYIPYWSQAGWETDHVTHDGSISGWVRILRRAYRADFVVILRRTFHFPFLNLLRVFSRQLIFDFDDAIFVRSSGEESLSKRARFGRTVRVCDQVWAGNCYLAENAAPFNKKILIIPTALQAEKYAIDPERPANHLDLVWIGSRSTRKHLLTLLPALERAAQLIPELRLKIIADFSIVTTSLVTLPIPWTAAGEAFALASSHIGIAPLPDNLFTRGKCGLKILQYMASGLPVIASPVGVNAELVQDDVTGYTAISDDQWVAAIQRLANDSELRRRMGEQGRHLCNKQYALSKVFHLLITSQDA